MLYRVSYFSAFCPPQHFDTLTKEQAQELKEQGQNQQFKVVISNNDDEPPQNMFAGSIYL